jgi:cytochrome c oxidase assembly protein subunit 15
MKTLDRAVVLWLSAVWVAVFLMVLLGGTTRLTGSGLSMVEWHPLMGTLPPMGAEAWDEVFRKYQQSPQYLEVNHWMELRDFKRIFFWEYLHRLAGRSIGLVFLVPWLVFVLRRRMSRGLALRTSVAFVLGGLQGLLGWYMVQSGLADVPRVSHLRLAAHLSLALFVAVYLQWILMDLLATGAQRARGDPVPMLRLGAWLLVAVVSLQIVWGAFMAGSRAGYLYTSFPLMNGAVVPRGAFQSGGFLNSMVMDPMTIHVVHRWFAWFVVGAVFLFWSKARAAADTRQRERSLTLLAGVVVVQFLLGVLTVVLSIPTWLGVAHQGGGVLLLAAAVMAAHAFGGGGPSDG